MPADQLPTGVHVVALAVPLFVTAGAVSGIAVAMARGDEATYYLIDNAPADGPPLWVHEAEISRCFVSTLPVRND